MKRSKKIRKGDKVVVITGNCKGQSGTVLHLKGDGVVVQGLNLKKKHVKPSQANQKGGVIEIEGAIHISNVAPCDESGKPVKLQMVREANGECNLCYSKGNEKVTYRQVVAAK